ncbi:MAG: hypothetical protein IJA21_03140 [Clostridia bacterium]|nr:hypothetical protein [Clostridia bacterium]
MLSVLCYAVIAIFACVVIGIIIGFIKASCIQNNRTIFRVMIAVTAVFAIVVSAFAFTVTDGFSGLFAGSVSSNREKAAQLIDASIVSAVIDEQYTNSNECGLKKDGSNYFISYKFGDGEDEHSFTVDLKQNEVVLNNSADTVGKAFVYKSCVLEHIGSADEFMNLYYDELSQFVSKSQRKFFSDIDNDGENEYVILVSGYLDKLLSKLDDSSNELADCIESTDICVFADYDSNSKKLIVHSIPIEVNPTSVSNVVYDNGMLNFVYSSNGEKITFRKVVGESQFATNESSYGMDFLRKMSFRYAKYLEDSGYTDVHFAISDFSDSVGEDVICCFSDGDKYFVEVLTLLKSRLHKLYSSSSDDGATYVLNKDSLYHIYRYYQGISDSNYTQTYNYELIRFDENYKKVVVEQDSANIKSSEGGESSSTFLQNVNKYLNDSFVCYDPYNLTGYYIMSDNINTTVDNSYDYDYESTYLTINNCNTSKTGIVTLNDIKSWLNFRNGPSTKYKRILIDPNNKKSYVKQVHNSIVTVIEPYNTGDKKNPIWLKVRISYKGNVLEGYSSQQFIDIPGIKHISVGDKFRVTADTNDTGLKWKCNDTSIATINSKTGEITAKKSGMVLVTVTSDSGLEDSCLIKID